MIGAGSFSGLAPFFFSTPVDFGMMNQRLLLNCDISKVSRSAQT